MALPAPVLTLWISSMAAALLTVMARPSLSIMMLMVKIGLISDQVTYRSSVRYRFM